MKGYSGIFGIILSTALMITDATTPSLNMVCSIIFKIIYISVFVIICVWLILDNRKEQREKMERDTAKRKKMIRQQWENDYAAFRKERNYHG